MFSELAITHPLATIFLPIVSAYLLLAGVFVVRLMSKHLHYRESE